MAATGQLSVEPRRTNPRGGFTTVSPWLITPRTRPAPALEQELHRAVLAPLRRDDLSTEEVAHGLHAVADAENGNAGLEEALVGQRGAVVVDARWAARENDPPVAGGQQLLHGLRAGDDLGIDGQLTDAASDQLGVLRAEIQDANLIHRG